MDWYKKLQDHLNVDVSYYGKNATYIAIGEGVFLVCGLLLSVAFTRLVSKEIYGQYNYILSIIRILFIFSLPGMSTSISQAVARGYDRVFVEGTKTMMKWSLLGSVIVFFIGVYYYLNGSITMGKCFMISAPIFPLFSSTQTYLSFLRAREQFKKASLFRSIVAIILTLVTIAVIYFSKDLLLIVITYTASFSIMHFSLLIVTMTSGKLNKNFDEKSLSFGKHMTAQSVIGTIAMHIDKIIIGIFLSFSDLAIYSIARMAELGVIFTPITTPVFIRLVKMDREEASRELRKRLKYVILLYALICGIGIALVPYAVPFLFTAEYSASILYAQIIVFSLLIEVPGGFLLALFKAHREIGKLYKITIIYNVAEIILLLGLVPFFGLLGAALAKVIAKGGFSITAWLLSRGKA